MKRTLLILTNIAFFFLASCASSYSRSLVSTKAASVPSHKVLGKVEAKDCTTYFWGYVIPANFRKMYSNTLGEATEMGGDAIVDFQVRETSMTSIFFLYTRYCYSATGTAVKFASGDASAWDAVPGKDSSEWDASPDAKKEEKKTKSEWD
jgi:hypothetical protein